MPSSPILRLKNIQKSFGSAERPLPVLRNISMSLRAGEFCALLGPSGSGKSSLLNIIGLLDQLDHGQMVLAGTDVSQPSPLAAARLRNQLIGFVFQSFHLLPRLSAWQNIALPLIYRGIALEERRSRALHALAQVGLSKRADHHPSQLSGGECQRIALARALIGAPKIVLADEPTGSLDSVTGQQIFNLLLELNHDIGLTILMVTHDRRLASACQRQIEIADGQLITEGEIG